MNSISGSSNWLYSYLTQSSSAARTSSATKSDPLAVLVEAGTITEEQQEAVKSALDESAMYGPPPFMANGEDPMSSTLSDLVDDGTISQEQADAISGAVADAMTPVQVNASSLSETLDELISDGTITEDQKEAILASMEEAREKMPPPPVPPEISDSLDSLVSAGTLTGEQEDAVISALESFDGSSSNPLQDLVDDGTLTQEQLDAVTEAFQNALKMRQAQAAYALTRSEATVALAGSDALAGNTAAALSA